MVDVWLWKEIVGLGAYLVLLIWIVHGRRRR